MTGKQILVELKKKGYTMYRIHKLLKVSYMTVMRWGQGETEPTRNQNREKLLDLLNNPKCSKCGKKIN